MTGSFQRYLRAKRTVDDRALDRRTLDTLRHELAARAADTERPLRVLEVGAGIGTMLTRFVEWDVLPECEIQYTTVDIESATVDALPDYLDVWATDRAVTVTTDPLVVDDANRRVTVDPLAGDAVAHAAENGGYDLLVGAALLDILDRDELTTLLGALVPDGLYYFPITFDGATRFRPSHPADRTIESHYHEHMDAKPGGDSRAGGDVLARLQQLDGVTILVVAGSDWVVRPIDGTYPADEAYFLSHILDTVERAVGEIAGDDADELDTWLARRRDQLSAAELLYHTHQLDFLGRVDGHSGNR